MRPIEVLVPVMRVLRRARRKLPREWQFRVDLLDNYVQDSGRQPLVSIVVPLYAEEEHVEECLESVRRQNYRHFECIVVNDCAIDDGPRVAQRIVDRDPRFRMVHHEANRGLAAARNTGLREARGEYVLFLDADDALIQHSIWHRMRKIRRSGGDSVAGAYCQILVTDESGHHPLRRLAQWRYAPEGMIKSFLTCRGECPFNAHAPIVRVDVLRRFGGFDESLRHGCEDWDLWLRILRHGYVFLPSEHWGAIYRQKPGSMVRTMSGEHFEQAARLVDRAYEAMPCGDVVKGSPCVLSKPLSHYEREMVKARRGLQFAAIAQMAGDEAARDRIIGTFEPDSPIFRPEFLEVEKMLASGVRRYLNLGPEEFRKVKRRYQGKIDALLRAVDSHVRPGHGPGPETASPTSGVDVAFMPHNAYHTYEMSFVVPHLQDLGLSFVFVNVDHVYKNEGAEAKMRELDLPFVHYSKDVLDRLAPRLLFVMNDWGGVVHDCVVEAKRRGIATCALVEGVQDYEDTHVEHIGVGRIRNAYRTAEYPLLVGEYDRKYITTDKAAVVGSPRMERLTLEPTSHPDRPLVAINSNFTYGVYTSIQKEWLDGAVEATRLAGVDYVISQHPADRFDLSGYRRAEEPLYDVLRRASLLVSKFSGAIYESMALGTPVVYHNPHGERVDTFQDPMGAYPITRSVEELAEVCRRVATAPNDYRSACKAFLDHHLSVDPDRPSPLRIAQRLAEILAS